MSFNMDQVTRTAARARQHPETVRRELLQTLSQKAAVAARDLLGAVASNTDFEQVRQAKYLKARSIFGAIEWHTDALLHLDAATEKVRGRIEEVRVLIAGDEALLHDLDEAVMLVDAASSLAKSLQAAWVHESARRLAAEELRTLRFGTCLAAVKGLLADAA